MPINAGLYERIKTFVNGGSVRPVDLDDIQDDFGGLIVSLTDKVNKLTPAVTSTFPANPVPDQIAYIQTTAMAALGVTWKFRARSNAPALTNPTRGPFKWEFVGGPPVSVNGTGTFGPFQTSNVDNYVPIPNSPSFTLPFAGDYLATLTYDIGIQGEVGNDVNTIARLQLFLNGLNDLGPFLVFSSSRYIDGATLHMARRISFSLANCLVTVRGSVNGDQGSNKLAYGGFAASTLTILPIRVA